MTHRFHSSLKMPVSASINLLPKRATRKASSALAQHPREGQMWNGYHRLLPWAAMSCLHCAKCTYQSLSPYSWRMPAMLGVYSQHVSTSTDNLKDSQKMWSPLPSRLLCSCLPPIFSSRNLGQVCSPHQPSG